jgi:hypothetical protein
VSAAAAVALGLAAERNPDCQQRCCQQATHSLQETLHVRNKEQDAMPHEKAHYFLRARLYCHQETKKRRGLSSAPFYH